MPNRRGRDRDWGIGTIVGVIAGMVIVVAVTAPTLDRKSLLVAADPVTETMRAWLRSSKPRARGPRRSMVSSVATVPVKIEMSTMPQNIQTAATSRPGSVLGALSP